MAKKSIVAGERAALMLAAGPGVCYRPECGRALVVTRGSNQVADFEIAHIRDELPPSNPDSDIGWRYWPDDLSQDDRNRYDNLILLCPPCHKFIDRVRPRDFSPELLHTWKRVAESAVLDEVLRDVLDLDAFASTLANALQERPHIELSVPSLDSNDGLSFASRSATLAGRSTELEALAAFLLSEEVVSWWTVVGEAGVGKSRLALECCHTVMEGWNAGFVRDAEQEAIVDFVPDRPTLLVVDYAAARAEWLGRILIGLVERSRAGWDPVRVLVLERTIDAQWHGAATFQHRHHDSRRIMAARYAEPLELKGLSRAATRCLITEVVSGLSDPPSSTLIEDLVDRAFELDPAGRPLFSLVAALEFSDPKLCGGSRDAVLRDLILRRNAQSALPKPLTSVVLELVTTILGGIDLQSYAALKVHEVPPFALPDVCDLPAEEIEEALGGMVPDILGELWVLDELASTRTRADACMAALDVVWRHNPARYAAFVARATRDHSFHEQLLILLNVDYERDLETWFPMVCSIIPHLGDPQSPRVSQVLDLLHERSPSPQRQIALAEAGFAIANLWLACGQRAIAHALYTKLIETAPQGCEVRWQSYTNRGVVEIDLGRPLHAETDFSAVVDATDASDESRACCLNNRADLRVEAGNHIGALTDRTSVLELRETSYNRRYIALARRAKSLWALKRFEEANEDIESILATTDIAVEQKMAARLMRAEWAIVRGMPAIAKAELQMILASRRNFPEVTEAAEALALNPDVLIDSAPAVPRTGEEDELTPITNPVSPMRQAYFRQPRGPT